MTATRAADTCWSLWKRQGPESQRQADTGQGILPPISVYGEAQGHDGINYSLASRDMIANMIEIHANATPFDGGVFIASCDKSMPAHLMAVGRINIPSIIVTGGVMDAGPDLLTLEQIGMYHAMYERGEITKEQMEFLQTARLSLLRRLLLYGDSFHHADHGGSAGPDAAGKRSDACHQQRFERQWRERRAGRRFGWQSKNLTPDRIVTMESFENAIMVHAAISGSTNSLLHIPAIAKRIRLLRSTRIPLTVSTEAPTIC